MSSPCQGCPELSIFLWRAGSQSWHRTQVNATGFRSLNASNAAEASPLDDFCVAIIIAEADRVRECERCRRAFGDAFYIPELWWASHCKNSNGYFGCEYPKDRQGDNIGFNTWSRFLIKQLRNDGRQHNWHKINIFTHWVQPTRQTILIIFDAPQSILARVPSPLLGDINPDLFVDPFWIYDALAGEVVRLQDKAVWAIRDQIRAVETERVPVGKPQPDYRRLHDMARHAIHVSETLDLAVEILQSILAQHDDFVMTAQNDQKIVSKDIHLRLLFSISTLNGLRHRSASNKERLQNEIQLTFNTVAQYDSGTSVNIGRAAQLDSAAMKTVAFLTLAFLPATFIAAIFSMSFFNFDANSGSWSISDKFWIYWALAVPITVITTTLWHYWQERFLGNLSVDDQGRASAISKRIW